MSEKKKKSTRFGSDREGFERFEEIITDEHLRKELEKSRQNMSSNKPEFYFDPVSGKKVEVGGMHDPRKTKQKQGQAYDPSSEGPTAEELRKKKQQEQLKKQNNNPAELEALRVQQEQEREERQKQAQKEWELQQRQKNRERARAEQEKRKQESDEWLHGVSSKWACVFAGIFPLFSRSFKQKFLDLTTYSLREKLLEYRTVFASVLHQSEGASNKIRAQLYKEKQEFDFELVMRFDMAYDEMMFQKLAQVPKSPAGVTVAKPMFLDLYKKISYITRYGQLFKSAIGRVLRVEQSLRHLDSGVVSRNMKRAMDAADFIIKHYLPILSTLIEYYAGNSGQSMSEFMNYSEEDRFGYYSKMWIADYEKEQERKERQRLQHREEEKRVDQETQSQNVLDNISEIDGIPESAKKGLQIIYHNVNFQRMLKFFHDTKDRRKLFQPNDKIFIIFSLLDFFEKEFSFIYTKNYIQFNTTVTRSGRKLDIKKSMQDLYYKFNEVYRKINQYVDVLVEISRHENGSMDYAKSNSKLPQQREEIFKSIVYELRQILPKLMKYSEILLSDYQKQKEIWVAPDEILEFGKSSSVRLCHKRKAVSAVNYHYRYLSAFYFLLTSGDLIPSSSTLKRKVYIETGIEEDTLPMKTPEQEQQDKKDLQDPSAIEKNSTGNGSGIEVDESIDLSQKYGF